jgi:hypothetical protein
VATWAAEPVIEIKMPESSIEVIKPHQTHDTATEPDAFRISSRTVDGLRRFREFIGLALAVLGDIGSRRLLWRLILCARISALGDGPSKSQEKGKA